MKKRKATKRLWVAILTVLLVLTGAAGAWGAAYVAINATNFPDAAFRSHVKQYDTSGDDELAPSERNAVTSIDVRYMEISDLAGIEHLTALVSLDCSYNQLTALDVSKNTALTELQCGDNQLTTLDVAKNTALTVLDCSHNQLTALDMSRNMALTELHCSGNQLTTLDVAKNTNLTWLECGYKFIAGMTNWGPQIVTAGNPLTRLDVSKNTALTELDCGGNQLTALDVSKNTALTYLRCGYNPLTTLDVSKNTALTQLDCSGNQLTTLDLRRNPDLDLTSVRLSPQTCPGLTLTVSGEDWMADLSAWTGAANLGNIVSADGQDASGGSLTPVYDAATGVATFSSRPSTVSYAYNTRFPGATPPLTMEVYLTASAGTLTVTTSSLPGGRVGAAYSATLTANSAGVTWEIASGTLPTGLSLDSSTGVISGTPTAAGTSTFTVGARNALGRASKQLSITIAASGGGGAIGPVNPVTPFDPGQQFIFPVPITPNIPEPTPSDNTSDSKGGGGCDAGALGIIGLLALAALIQRKSTQR